MYFIFLLPVTSTTGQQYLAALSLGIRTPVLNGPVGPIFKRLVKAFDAGDMDTATQEQVQARRLKSIVDKYGNTRKSIVDKFGNTRKSNMDKHGNTRKSIVDKYGNTRNSLVEK